MNLMLPLTFPFTLEILGWKMAILNFRKKHKTKIGTQITKAMVAIQPYCMAKQSHYQLHLATNTFTINLRRGIKLVGKRSKLRQASMNHIL